MDAEILHEVVALISDELNEFSVLKHLDPLANALRKNDLQEAERLLASAEEVLDQCPSNRLIPSRDRVFRSIGGLLLTGNGLAQRLRGVTSEEVLSPAEEAAIIEGIRKEIHKFHGIVNNLRNYLGHVNISIPYLPADECEIGVIYTANSQDHLDTFIDELKDLDRHMRVFNEIGGAAESPRVRALASGSYEIYLAVTTTAAAAVALAIDKILAWRKSWWETELLKIQVREKTRNNSAVQAIEEQQEAERAAALEAAERELWSHYTIKNQARSKEVQIALTQALRFILLQVEKGVVFEVRAPLPKDTPRDLPNKQQTLLSEIRSKGGGMRDLLRAREQLLLPSATADETDAGAAGVHESD